MKPRHTLRHLAAAGMLAALLPLSPAHAQSGPADHDDDDDGTTHWGLGLAVSTERKPYTNFDNKTSVVPLLLVDNRYVRVFGPILDAKLPSLGPVSFTLRAKYALDDGYKSSDAPILSGLQKRKAGFWLGGTATWHAGFADLTGELLGDASSASKGSQFKLVAEHAYTLGAFGLTPRIAAIWLDRKYVDYYFGVRANEANALRPKYDGRSTTNTEVGLRASYQLAPRQMLILDISATSLGTTIKDSPLVDRTSVIGGRFGYVYRF